MENKINQYNKKVEKSRETREKFSRLREEYYQMMSKISEETNKMYQIRYQGGNTWKQEQRKAKGNPRTAKNY